MGPLDPPRQFSFGTSSNIYIVSFSIGYKDCLVFLSSIQLYGAIISRCRNTLHVAISCRCITTFCEFATMFGCKIDTVIEYLDTALSVYINFWRVPVGSYFSQYSQHFGGLLADLAFIWLTTFSSVNLMLLFFDGNTLWGYFDGFDRPFSAIAKSAIFFIISPIVIIAGFVTQRYETKDASIFILSSWLIFMTGLASVINIIL